MLKRPASLALIAVAIPAFAGIAYAATQSVSSEPAPKVVVPTPSSTEPDPTAATAVTPSTGPSQGPATGGDDLSTPSATVVSERDTTGTTLPDDPAAHDLADDHGGGSGDGADDPATHDLGDDHGGERGSGSDDPADHDAGDDRGR
jgi:hypothetical protein